MQTASAVQRIKIAVLNPGDVVIEPSTQRIYYFSKALITFSVRSTRGFDQADLSTTRS